MPAGHGAAGDPRGVAPGCRGPGVGRDLRPARRVRRRGARRAQARSRRARRGLRGVPRGRGGRRPRVLRNARRRSASRARSHRFPDHPAQGRSARLRGARSTRLQQHLRDRHEARGGRAVRPPADFRPPRAAVARRRDSGVPGDCDGTRADGERIRSRAGRRPHHGARALLCGPGAGRDRLRRRLHDRRHDPTTGPGGARGRPRRLRAVRGAGARPERLRSPAPAILGGARAAGRAPLRRDDDPPQW